MDIVLLLFIKHVDFHQTSFFVFMNILSKRVVINTNRVLLRSFGSKSLIYGGNNIFSSNYPLLVYERYFSNKSMKGCTYI